ncbi:hypothetical protein PENSTE_c010G08634 [Penicillium steckii]|uniref:Uncharacterized protein n=1 Tax=Penicillium steckii TaxID=303698 RepID=A0A1V6T809_9EURO|nr:hypothetical protein PENSTE_c010G08634 [Penicillium steckii]
MPQFIDHRMKYAAMDIISLTDQPESNTLIKHSISPYHTTAVSSTSSVPTPKHDHSSAEWGVGWRSPTLMIGLFLCGLSFSVGHHVYYKSLDDTLVKSTEEQTWALRIGTGFAFVVKTLLVAAIGIAAVQQIWATLRRKSVNLRGIDAMFSILNDPLAFFAPDMWLCAKTLTLLAIISWLIPLTALITPATLSVHLKTTPSITRLSVPTVEFNQEFWKDWALTEGAGWIYGPSYVISRLLTTTSSSSTIIPLTPPLPNSSYTLEFYGPSYKCQNLSEVIAETKGITYTDRLGGNYSSFQEVWHKFAMNSSDNKVAKTGIRKRSLREFNRNVSCLQTVEHFLCAGCILQQYRSDPRPYFTELVAPCDWDSYSGMGAFIEPHADRPEGLGGYYITHLLFSALIEGSLSLGSTLALLGDAKQLMQSGLFECPELLSSTQYTQYKSLATPTCRNKTLAGALEDLSRNFTYSLLSLNAASTNVPVSVNSPKNFYSYNWKNLFAAYLTALMVTFVCIIIGLFALWGNGVPENTSFSNLLRTTRNPDLDALATGHCLGSDHLPDELKKVRLRFGEIETTRPFKHASFGLEESVIDLVKGEKYS